MRNPYFGLLKAVFSYGVPWRNKIIGLYLAFIIAQGALSLGPYAFGKTIDLLQNFSKDKIGGIIFWLVFGVLAVLLFWLFHGPARVVERNIAMKIKQKFEVDIYDKLAKLPLKWHQDHHSGNTLSRLNRSATALHRFSFNQFIYIETIVKFIASLGFLLWISIPLGLISLLTSMSVFIIIMAFDKKLIPLYDSCNEIDNKVSGVLFDYISNMTTILTLRLGERSRKNFSERLKDIWPPFKKEVVLNEVKWFLMAIFLNISQSLILITYILYHLNSEGFVMIGTVVMLFRYQGELAHVFQELSLHYSELVQMYTNLEGIKPILSDIDKFVHKPIGIDRAKKWHTIKIENLTFHHEDKNRGKIFTDFSLTINKKEKVALIGESGGGKSTLLNLLRGLYIPKKVGLIIDDESFDTLEPLEAITTLIPQDPEIFENTIGFNITLDLPTTKEHLDEAIKLSKFSSVLQYLPDGLSTDIREKGLNFSVGQKQRLALSRGLFAARFSSLILMDEPTSSVDLSTEKEILKGVLETFSDATIIVSLHRLHLLPIFDRIIMLENGKIVADGSPKELLKTKGPVFDLWDLQK